MSSQQNASSFSLNYSLAPQTKTMKKLDFSANDKEKEILVQILELESLHSLKASFSFERKNNFEADLSAHIHAEFTQLCVVSLESIPSRLDFSFKRHLVKELSLPSSADEEAWENLESEQDIWDGKNINLADMIIEEMMINIDSYPRKEGVELNNIESVESTANIPETAEKVNPFSVLSQLKAKK